MDFTPKTYRKTALMQAIPWQNSPECLTALLEWGASMNLDGREDGSAVWQILTKEGWRDVAHADGFICRGPAGDFYEQDRAILLANHELVTDTAVPAAAAEASLV